MCLTSGIERPYQPGCASCNTLRGSFSRHSGCWNKKSRPQNMTKTPQLFPFSSCLTTLVLSLFSVTFTCFPLVATATTTTPKAPVPPSSSSSSQSPNNNNNNYTDIASQKGYSVFFSLSNLKQSPMSTFLGQNLTAGYLDTLMREYGTNGSMGKDQLSEMMEKVVHTFRQQGGAEHHKVSEERDDHETNSQLHSLCTQTFLSGTVSRKNGTDLNYSMEADVENEESLNLSQYLLSCHLNKCLNSSSIFQFYNLTDNYRLTRTDLFFLSPLILQQVNNCQQEREEVLFFSKSSEAWAYGFLFVTVINICALVGVVVLPIMNTRLYKKVLVFLVALAVGSLAGSGLLVLIPEAFELVGTREKKHAYLWIGTTIMSGIYLFFLIERLLKLLFEWKKRGKSASEADYDVIMNLKYNPSELRLKKKDKNENRQIESTTDELSDMVCSVKSKTPVDHDTAKMKDPANYHASASQCTSHLSRTESTESIEAKLKKNSTNNDDVNLEVPNGCMHARFEGGKKKKAIRTVAWMIIFGDGLHNFIDGLSIGAAFTANTMTGVSVSVAVICEELPHELGDFAILLNAGMSMKQALCFNFLSACMCYIGLIFGILLAEATAAHTWIFGVAGGMFLYISLVDMMPEMNQVVEAKENRELGVTQLFLLQNAGMVLGFGIILLISFYADHIKFGS